MSFGPLFLTETSGAAIQFSLAERNNKLALNNPQPTGYSPDRAGLIIALMNATVLLAPVAGWILDAVGSFCYHFTEWSSVTATTQTLQVSECGYGSDVAL